MLTIMGECTPLILEVKGEGHDGHHLQMWGARGCYALRCYIYKMFYGRAYPNFWKN